MAENTAFENCPSMGQLEGLAFGNLPESERLAVQAHLPSCPDCREIYEALAEAGAAAVGEAAQEIGRRVDERVREKAASAAKPRGRLVRMAAGLAAAASIAGLGAWAMLRLDAAPAPSTVAQQGQEQHSSGPINANGGNLAAGHALGSGAALEEAQALADSGDYAGAVAILEPALRQAQPSGKAMMLLGVCRLRTHDYSGALDAFRKVQAETKEEARELSSYIGECEAALGR